MKCWIQCEVHMSRSPFQFMLFSELWAHPSVVVSVVPILFRFSDCDKRQWWCSLTYHETPSQPKKKVEEAKKKKKTKERRQFCFLVFRCQILEKSDPISNVCASGLCVCVFVFVVLLLLLLFVVVFLAHFVCILFVDDKGTNASECSHAHTNWHTLLWFSKSKMMRIDSHVAHSPKDQPNASDGGQRDEGEIRNALDNEVALMFSFFCIFVIIFFFSCQIDSDNVSHLI